MFDFIFVSNLKLLSFTTDLGAVHTGNFRNFPQNGPKDMTPVAGSIF